MKATRLIKQLLAAGTAKVAKETRVNPQALGLPNLPAGKLSEAAFQGRVIDLAHCLGWRVAHFRHAMTGRTENGKPKFVTPVAADGKGFLDLELVRDRVVKAELKVAPNKTTPEQEEWLLAYQEAAQEAYVWYPEQWEEIVEVLSRRKS